MTLKGHKEAVSAIRWIAEDEIVTSSWDHTLKFWDVTLGGVKSELAGNKAFFDLDYSYLNKLIITASADRHIRLYDPRSTGKILLDAQEKLVVEVVFYLHLVKSNSLILIRIFSILCVVLFYILEMVIE